MTDKNKLQEIIVLSTCDFQYLYNFIQNVKDYYPKLSEQETKKKVLEVIKILLEKRILDIYNFSDEKKWEFSIEKSIKRINKIWFKEAGYVDFINMIFFKRQEWFYEELKSKGYNFQDNWFKYVSKSTWLKDLLKIDKQ